jgi:hypothetical protein
MMSRNLSLRLERLEESAMASSIQHVITVKYVNPDGTPAGGYRIEGPLPNGDFLRTPLELEQGQNDQ